MPGDIGRLDVDLLLTFDALMRERNVTRTAANIGLTQQAVSGHIRRLRELFDDPLFVRRPGGVSPTPRADGLYPRVQAALASLDAVLEAPEFDPARSTGTIRLAASDYAVATLLVPVLERVRAEAPGMRLAVVSFNSATLADDMHFHRVDLALTIPQFVPPGLSSERLFRERYVGAARRGHPILKKKRITIDALCAHAHILVSPDKADFTGPTDAALQDIGRSREVAIVLPAFSVALDLLRVSDLIAVLPERLLAHKDRQVATFDLPLPVAGFDMVVAWPARLDADPAQRWFRELCAACAARDFAPG